MPSAQPPPKPLATRGTLHLYPCTAADIPRLTSIYLSSFADPLSHACFPRASPATAPWWTSMNVEDFAEQPSARFLKVVDVSQPTDIFSAGQPPDGLSVANGDGSGSAKLIAYGKWNVPTRSPTTGELVSGGDDPDAIHEGIWPEGGDRELATEFFGELARRRRRIMGAERGEGLRPHAYLEIVCTLPEYQGRGAASLILKWGTALADAQGLECYCEAGPGLVELYARYGFEVVEEFRPTRIEHVESLMVRKAR